MRNDATRDDICAKCRGKHAFGESLRRAIQEDAVDGVVGHIICDRVKLEIR